MCGPGRQQAAAAIPAALAAMRLHILATTERAKDVVGLDSHFIAVGPSGIWLLGSDGGIVRAPDRWAVGCGEDIGIGAMFDRPGSAADIVEVAVRAACALREGCFGAPILFVA